MIQIVEGARPSDLSCAPSQLGKEGEWALGAMRSQGPLGGRHFFREALALAPLSEMEAVFKVLADRGFAEEALSRGEAETLRAATFGRRPAQALSFLAGLGFSPPFELANAALEAVLNEREPAIGLSAARPLIERFGAGLWPNSAAAREALAALSKELSALSEAHFERWVLGREIGPMAVEKKERRWL